MNKTAIKNFAIWARRELIESVTKTAKLYEIEKDNIKEDIESTLNGKILTEVEKSQRKTLINKINADGFDVTMEEVAYTWFNRFIAVRFMEVNGYLPSHIRVFSGEDGSFNPEIISECMTLEMECLDKAKVIELYNAANKDELFQYLFVCQCNELGKILPGMFEKISDYTELLLPSGLLKDGSVIKAMVEDIPEEDWTDQVQIIGWMYQYYNTEPKDKVFSRPKSKKIEKEDVPAATQLFTPDWIVKYMVENSLGRLWIEGHPNDSPKGTWKYYLDEAEQEPEVEEKIVEIRKTYENIDPKDIKCIDPCMGSGHILCYLFDVLVQIYEAYGYKSRDAARLIIENNLYGLDIDERARQLSYFSVMMKARQYDRRIFAREDIKAPKIYSIIESNLFANKENKYALNYFVNGEKELEEAINSIISDMIDAKEYGSITKAAPVDFDLIYNRINEIENGEVSLEQNVILSDLLPIIKQAEVLSKKYEIVVTNPPYMGSSGMDAKLAKYVKDNYADSKSDLFAVFIEKCNEFTKANGFQEMITQNYWMFLSSYEKLREKFQNIDLINMAHLGPRAFDEIGGEVVQTTSFVIKNSNIDEYKGTYVRLIEPTTQAGKEDMFLKGENKYIASQGNFKIIPGMPVAYWVTDNVLKNFKIGMPLGKIASPRKGNSTSNNNRFLKLWYEVDKNKLNLNANKIIIEDTIKKRWYPYNKGGGYRKWYGNNFYVIDWFNDAAEIRNIKTAVIANYQYFMKPGLTWSTITTKKFSIRWFDEGFIFDNGGCCIFDLGKKRRYIAALMNSSAFEYTFGQLNPTLNFQSGEIAKFPIIYNNEDTNVDDITTTNVHLSSKDWDMHETSWDFEKSPLLVNKVDGFILSAYESYKTEVNERFAKLKENEEELNRIFIDIYGIQEELTPEVLDKDITVAKIFDSKNDIDDEIKGNKYILTREDVVKNFLSYFIGCVMGRYSLDIDGLAYAGGEFDNSKYKTFKPDEDGIIPLTNEEYFEDDIIVRLEEFLNVTFGEEHLKENMEFIASELKGKASDTARDKIRNYFINDFYKDHCKMYQKRPIYWLCDSGKLGASRNLIYMHRYQKDTFARLRIRYVFEIQDRYKQELERLENLIDNASGADKVSYQKQADQIKKMITETEKYEEKVQHIADSYIEIDLDDGVKENYKKFGDVLAKIK